MAKTPEIKQPMWTITEHGLTKRELFAAMAMQGLLAAWGQHDVTDVDELAHDAALHADAMLARLEVDDAGN